MEPVKKKIIVASQDRAALVSEQIDKILEAIDISCAMVTDESQLYDFPVEEEECKEISEKLGVEVELSDRIVNIAERMLRKQNNQQ